MQYTPNEVLRVLKEISAGTVILTCAKHGYAARRHLGPGGKPGGIEPPATKGCSECWRAYNYSDYAITPPHMRAQRVDEYTEVVHKMVEAEDRGQWDFYPEEHPEVRFIQDGFDDEANDYREDK